jgi:aminopeptidase N
VASQGQSFDGFLHLPEESFLENRAGASELFRAHEVAHQWWGHSVRRGSYRDQWLSEAFSEYSAMMFVEATVHDGDDLFKEMLRVYYDLVVGSFESSFSRFARPVLTQMSRRDRDRLGPIGVGYRASTHRAPEGYFIQAYYKGALVLHMLRLLLREQSGSDELFVTTLRDFLRAYRGKVATTKDFQAHLEEKTSGDWSSFFDQWIYHNAIPNIQWRHTAEKESDDEGLYLLSLHINRENAETGLAIPLPVRVKQENGSTSDHILVSREVEETLHLRFPSRVKKVEVNPDRSVLIKTKKD